jgi:hypothetical protein
LQAAVFKRVSIAASVAASSPAVAWSSMGDAVWLIEVMQLASSIFMQPLLHMKECIDAMQLLRNAMPAPFPVGLENVDLTRFAESMRATLNAAPRKQFRTIIARSLMQIITIVLEVAAPHALDRTIANDLARLIQTELYCDTVILHLRTVLIEQRYASYLHGLCLLVSGSLTSSCRQHTAADSFALGSLMRASYLL